MKANLFFATNRNHEGKDQWKPKGYGKKFSADGHYNLRFGELSLDYDGKKVKEFLQKKYKEGRRGDGEKLLYYFAKQAKKADITAYEDATASTDELIPFEKNSSTRFFKNLKAHMDASADVVVLIHGYNVSWEEAVGTALSFEFMINRHKQVSDKKTLVVLFSWPSDGSMMPFAAYKSDRSDARDSAQAVGRGFLKLRDFLNQVRTSTNDGSMKPCNRKIHLVCHSMGNYVFRYALKKLQGYTNNNRLPLLFENVFLCAADVDDDILEIGKDMDCAHELCNHLSVYYNNGDVAMHISDYTKGNPQRLGHTGLAHPQLVHNKIHQVDCSAIVRGIVEHCYFLWSTVNDDISMTIEGLPFDHTARKRKRLANSREWKLE